MKNVYYLLFMFVASFGIAHSVDFDEASDILIESCFESATFQNITLLYSFEDQDLELRIIFNPQKDKIALNNGESSSFQMFYGVFSKANIPEHLRSHLEEIIKSKLNSTSGGMWSSGSFNGKKSIDYFADATGIPQVRTPAPLEAPKEAPKEAAKEAAKEAPKISIKINEMDQDITDLFKEDTFRKLSLKYNWEGKSYTVHFVHNPMKETLVAHTLSKRIECPVAMTIEDSTYPLSLAKHLESLVPRELYSGSLLDIADWTHYTRKNPVSFYKALHPVTILTSIENPDEDLDTLTFFTSSELSRKSLYYELDGSFYSVLLIHNPENIKLYSNLSFDTWDNGNLNQFVSWNYKIGIFVDTKAPQELMDHLSHLYELSWWDSYWNLTIYNGDMVKKTYSKGDWQYTYTPYSWYTHMLNAK